MDIYIDSQIVVQTAADWAADTTVYSEKRLLVTSDAYYVGTNQRKFKIPDGNLAWSALDYMPVAEILPYFIIRSTGAAAERWKVTIDDTGMLNTENLGV